MNVLSPRIMKISPAYGEARLWRLTLILSLVRGNRGNVMGLTRILRIG